LTSCGDCGTGERRLARILARVDDPVSRAQGGSIDGGIADYSGSMICEYRLIAGGSGADAARPIATFRFFHSISMTSIGRLRCGFHWMRWRAAERGVVAAGFCGREEMGGVLVVLFVLHEKGWMDLRDPASGNESGGAEHGAMGVGSHPLRR